MTAPSAHQEIRISSRRAARIAQDNFQAGTQPDATATAVIIEGLRRQLKRSEAFEHPAVQQELRKLEELLIALYEQAGRHPGRHRSEGAGCGLVSQSANRRPEAPMPSRR